MAKYKVLQMSFIDGQLVNAGDTVEYAGDPGPNLQAVGKREPAMETAPQRLLQLARQHASSQRGVSPNECNEGDVNAVLKDLGDVFTEAEIAEVKKILSLV